MVKRDMNASSTWFGRKVECCIGARPTVENQTRWWHLQLQSMLCVADLHHLLTAPSVHHMASTGFFLSLCQCLCFCLCQKSLCPFLCPYLLCNMFTSIAWASRNVGADAPHPNRTRSFDHDNVPLSQNKTLSLMSWKVDVFCHAELQILFVVGALATPWPDRQRDLQAPLDLTLCNIHRQAVLGLQSAQSWSLPWWNLDNQIMAAVALTFVLGVDGATNCYTLQNHCCFELGEKLSKNDSAKTNNIYIQTPGQNC